MCNTRRIVAGNDGGGVRRGLRVVGHFVFAVRFRRTKDLNDCKNV